MKQNTTPKEASITTGTFPASRKIFVPGILHDIKVAMREVTVSPTISHSFGVEELKPNPVVTLYDTSGPYTDPSARIDVTKGLPRLR